MSLTSCPPRQHGSDVQSKKNDTPHPLKRKARIAFGSSGVEGGPSGGSPTVPDQLPCRFLPIVFPRVPRIAILGTCKNKRTGLKILRTKRVVKHCVRAWQNRWFRWTWRAWEVPTCAPLLKRRESPRPLVPNDTFNRAQACSGVRKCGRNGAQSDNRSPKQCPHALDLVPRDVAPHPSLLRFPLSVNALHLEEKGPSCGRPRPGSRGLAARSQRPGVLVSSPPN